MITLSLIGSLLSSFMLLFTIFYGLYKNYHDRILRYYSYFGLCAFGILFTMFLTYAFPNELDLTLVNKITQASTVLTFSALFVLSLIFPKTEKQVPFLVITIILVPAYIIAYIAVFTDMNITAAYFKDGKLVREFRFFYTVYLSVAFGYVLLGVINFIRKYITTKVELYRKQMRFVFIGTGIAMTFAAVFSIIMPRFFGYVDLYVLGPSLATFIGVSSLFYAVISYQMMDIRTAIHKTTMYTVISTAIFLPMFALVYIYDINILGLKTIPLYIIAFIIVVMFMVLSKYIQPIIDKAFKRKHYELQEYLDTFVKEISTIRDIDELIKKTVSTIHNTFYLKSTYFLLYNNEVRSYQLEYSMGEAPVSPSINRLSPIVRWFNRNQRIVTLDNVYIDETSFIDVRDEFIQYFTTNNIIIMIPIYHRRVLTGILCLGEKDTLAAYKPDEIELLSFLSNETNINLSHAITYQEAKKEQMLQRTITISSELLAKAVPRALPNIAGIKYGAFYIPRQGGGIDYFDFIRPGLQGIGTIATDIAGIGMQSALYSVIMRSAFHTSLSDAHSSYSVIQKLNRVIHNYSQGKGILITAYYYYIDVRNMRLIYTNAGFPPMELYRVEKSDFSSLDTEGIPLGYDPTFNYGMGRTNILRGDIGILYSKALITSKNSRGEQFTLDHVRNIIKENRMKMPSDIATIIQDEFKAFMGISSPESDIVVIIFKSY
ncbi:MAG TPA: SpoIIE family protein phosphatase [Spirochaetota bacterium]|nr:SpoIIE family protein phosphatase [Spirochaetota bacterium]HPP50237.1 SpoIIE family protein phosphatase [Spirochaetota bacterium]